LIENTHEHRWRGRYNEDVDLCLRTLKSGYCTIQFNAFLQGKAATQTVKGGNMGEIYKGELTEDEKSKLALNGRVDPTSTLKKSQMLVDMHPDVARMVFKYGRWHHYVDYSVFKKNKLRYKKGVKIPEGVNNYNMELVTLDKV
jgi:hypothetical protein